MSPKKKLFIIIFVFVGFSIISISLVLLTKRFDNPDTADNKPVGVDQNSYIDPSTGEKVLNPTGKAVEPASGYEGVVILGLSKLLDAGLSTGQIDSIKYDLNKLAESNKVDSNNITEISLVSDSLSQSIDRSTGLKKVLGVISLNRGLVKYSVEFIYYRVTDMKTKIFDQKKGSLVYKTEFKD